MELAEKNEIKTIAFPNISTGVYGFPKEEAADIALKEVKDFLKQNNSLKQVIFCVFDEENYNIYKKKLTWIKL